MSEYIERKAAYRFCKEQLEKETGAFSKGWNAGLKVAMAAVMNKDAIPDADVRPVVRGKWVSVTFRDVGCSECGFIMDIMETNKHILNHANFCPNCGADMREES